MAPDVLVEEREGAIATVTMNRPDALNALDESLSFAMIDTLERVAADRGVRCVVITGAGRAFSSGADLAEARRRIDEGGTLRPSEILIQRYHRIVEAIVTMEKPVLAAVNGVAAGAGASVAYACDFRIASDKAAFLQAFVKIGLVPDAGSNYFLPRLIGTAKALELSMTGDAIDAETALRIGLVTSVVPHDDLMKQTHEWAERFASGPTRAYALTKRALRFGGTHDLSSVLGFEADLQDQASLTRDAREGIQAFIEKRPPTFEGA